jgi:hypothetical protein
VYFTKYLSGDQTKEDEMGRACSMHDMRNSYNILLAKPEGKGPLGRPRHRWKYDI